MNEPPEHEVSIPLVEQSAPLRAAPDRTTVDLSLTDPQPDEIEQVNGGQTRPPDANDVVLEAYNPDAVSRRSSINNPEVNAASDDEESRLTTTLSAPETSRPSRALRLQR